MHYGNLFSGNQMPFAGVGGFVLVVLIVWSLVWKGLALWRAAKRDDSTWFVILLVLNTVGILEIIYYFVIAKGEPAKKVD